MTGEREADAQPASAGGPSPETGEPGTVIDNLDLSTDFGVKAELPRVLKMVAAVIAPATLVTALLFYFGYNHAYWYFQYFGVNDTVLDLTTQDYWLRSADALFVPLAAVVGICLLSVWIYRIGSGRLDDRSRTMFRLAGIVVAAVVGIVALIIAIVGVLNPAVFESAVALPGLCLSGSVVLLAIVSRTQRVRRERSEGQPPLPSWVGLAEIGFLFVLVSGGLFWSVTNYSAAAGSARGYATQRALAAAPDAVLYSERSLSIPAVSAREDVCPQSDGAYRYRYTGLKLVFASGSQFFFLPAKWPGSGGLAIVLPRTDALRLEFVAPGLAQGATC